VDWTDGYLSDVTYPVQFYRQTTPAWLSMAAILAGHRPPSIAQKFRWCDLGCGQGFTALTVAACHPQAEIFGFDFNPSHIDNARLIAAEAGLGNAVFEDVSFEALANAPEGAYPKMDFIVLHGIWTWVSTTQRAHLLTFISRQLAPGGIVYIAYNALAGWAWFMPVQRVMRLISEIHPGPADDSIKRGMEFVRELIRGEAEFFQRNPQVVKRLEFLDKQDAHYLSHELLHASWDPTPFDAVARDLAEVKCSFMGSASLLENLEAFAAPPGLAGALARNPDIRLREAIRDLGAARMFRRDMYRRGSEKPPAGELAALFDEIVLTDLGREDTGEIKIQTWGDAGVGLKMDVYAPVLQRLRTGPLRMGELRRALGDLTVAMEVLSVLAATNFAHPTPNPEPDAALVARTRALNRAITRRNVQGAVVQFQVSPKLGTAVSAEEIETMIVTEMLGGEGRDLLDRLMTLFQESGRSLYHDGKAITDTASARNAWRQMVDGFMVKRMPLFQRAGVLDE